MALSRNPAYEEGRFYFQTEFSHHNIMLYIFIDLVHRIEMRRSVELETNPSYVKVQLSRNVITKKIYDVIMQQLLQTMSIHYPVFFDIIIYNE